MSIVASDGASLNEVRHAIEGQPEVATVGVNLQQRRHCGIKVLEMGLKLGSVHAHSIGVAISPLETNVRRLRPMDENQTLSLFE